MLCPARDPESGPSGVRTTLRPLALAVLALVQAGAAAQGNDTLSPLRLRPAPALTGPSSTPAQGLPVFLFGDRLSGRTDLESVVEGDARLRRGDTSVRADRIEYYAPEDRLRARGQVRINHAGDVFEGPELELRVESFEGSFRQPRYEFLRTGGQGEADRVDFLDDKRAVIHNASYSTCRRSGGPDWVPDWVLNASRIALDNEEETGRAEGAVVRFKDIPILPVPALTFPLGDRRKSGWLSPSFGLDSVNGLELAVPYYWNIAPNRDATLYSTLMARRGIDLGAEFRYLESAYRGEARLNVMPSDRLRDRIRWGLTAQHSGQLAPNIGLNLRAARVSDDNYWRDFTRNGTSLTERLLPTELTVSGGVGPFATVGRWLQWQTLQDANAPIVPPYDRAPQFNASYVRTNLAGFDASVEMDYTRFIGDALRTGQPNTQRSLVIGRLSRPWVWPAGFVTPKLQLHASRYSFDGVLSNGSRDASRTVPSFSIDSGLVFERRTEVWGRALTQTLEPRAFYVHTPYRDQSHLPNYDSGALDFNLATIFSENSYVGNDRIADNHLLTLGVTSRLLDPFNGAELARFGMAQRLRLRDQRVTLPGEAAVSERLSDMLLGGSLNWTPQWLADATVQFNPKTRRSIRTTLGGRYNPSPYRTVSAAYRLQRGQSEQLDLGWQWPLNDLWGDRGQELGAGLGQGAGRWYSVGRLNYSLRDSKLVDAIVGFEYDAGCWLGRVVFERLQSGVSTASTRVLVQLELVGLSRIGSNPLKTLRENIPRYQYLREQTRPPNRFSNYE